MGAPCVGTVFDWEPNPKFLLLKQGSARLSVTQKELSPARSEWWPQRGARERHRESSTLTDQGYGAGRGPADVDYQAGRGAWVANQSGQSAQPAAARPLPAGALARLCSALLAARHPGRGARVGAVLSPDQTSGVEAAASADVGFPDAVSGLSSERLGSFLSQRARGDDGQLPGYLLGGGMVSVLRIRCRDWCLALGAQFRLGCRL